MEENKTTKTTTKKVTEKKAEGVKKVTTTTTTKTTEVQPEIKVETEVKVEAVEQAKAVEEKPNIMFVNEDKSKNRVIEKKPVDEDAAATKKYAWLAYILFFIPLCINSQSPFVRHHANEGLELNIVDVISILFLILGACVKTSVVWLSGILIGLAIIGGGALVLTTITKIYMICRCAQGSSQESPWFSNIKIIK